MAIEILASLLVVVSLVKIIFVLLNAPTWLSLVKRLYARPRLTSLVATSLAGLVLYFLLQSGLTIVHVLAVSVFTALLFVAGLSPLASQILKWFEGKNTAQMLKEQRLYTATWFVLLAWGAYELVAVSISVASKELAILSHMSDSALLNPAVSRGSTNRIGVYEQA